MIIVIYEKTQNGDSKFEEKTEVLWSEDCKMKILGEEIKSKNSIVWLGYTLTISIKSLLGYSISNKKLFPMDNLVTMFCKYNNNIIDRRVFYMTYIKPCIDYMMICLNCKDEIYKLEARIVKKCIGIESTASSNEALLVFGLYDSHYRTKVMANRMLESGLLKCDLRLETFTRSGRVRTLERCQSTVDKLAFLGSNLCQADEISFDLDVLVQWKKRVSVRIRSYSARGNDRAAHARAPVCGLTP